MYTVLMGSSRTYLVIGGCLFLIAWYWYGIKKTTFIATYVPIALLGAYFVTHSSMWDKILYTLDDSRYGDFWFRITSSRSVLWTEDLKAWKAGNLIQKVCGGGIEKTVYASGLWAHNDFIEILCSFEVGGLIQYLYITLKLIKKGFERKNTVKLIKACAVITWRMNAFFNMQYTYFCATLTYPFILLAIHEYYKERNTEKTE